MLTHRTQYQCCQHLAVTLHLAALSNSEKNTAQLWHLRYLSLQQQLKHTDAICSYLGWLSAIHLPVKIRRCCRIRRCCPSLSPVIAWWPLEKSKFLVLT